VRYILSCQNPDGGFYGRDPDSDLYYTGFALRSLLVLNALDTPTCEKVGTFLSQRLHSQTSLVDFFSLVYSAVIVSMGGGPDVFASSGDWTDTIGTFLASLRGSDGGFGKVPGGKESSTYMSFLALLCHQLIGKKIVAPDSLVAVPMTTAPCFANSTAMARPIPRDAPVTKAICPVNVLTISPKLSSLLYQINNSDR
jgi:geranylgeranyl transferase type-2 subunit beta